MPLPRRFQALVALDIINTRIKDFYDIWSPSRGMEFEGAILARAIAATLHVGLRRCPNKHREVLPKSSAKTRLSKHFGGPSSARAGLMLRARPLGQVVIELGAFLLPPAIGARSEEPFRRRWSKGMGITGVKCRAKSFLGYWISRILAQGFDRLPQDTGRIKLQNSWGLF